MNPAPLSIDLNEDHHHMHLLMISPKPQSSSSSCPASFNPDHQYHGLSQADKYDPTRENIESDSGLKLAFKVENQTENSTSSKWIPSKLRILRKMTNSDQAATSLSSNHKQKFEDQKQPSSSLEIDTSTNNNNTIRVCTDCNTTKTPLWRSGPRGPKSLCNACGIRQRKARRAAAAAAAANGTGHAAETPSVKSKVEQKHKVKRSNNGCVAQYKKPCKLATDPSASSRKNLCFEDFTVSLRKKYAAFQQVFPQDEKEAAILLMALSYGLVRG